MQDETGWLRYEQVDAMHVWLVVSADLFLFSSYYIYYIYKLLDMFTFR